MDSIRNNGKEAAEAIRSYVKPIFGFALNRVKHRAEAEDLAQEIMLQLLKSFSGIRDIRSLDAYVWTVARYTWVNWLKNVRMLPKRSKLTACLNCLPPLPGNRLTVCWQPKLHASCAEKWRFCPTSIAESWSCITTMSLKSAISRLL